MNEAQVLVDADVRGRYAGEEIMSYANEEGWDGEYLGADEEGYDEAVQEASDFLEGIDPDSDGNSFFFAEDGSLLFGNRGDFYEEDVEVSWGNCKRITLKRDDAYSLVNTRGAMDHILREVVRKDYVRDQFENCFSAEDVRSELKETGAWDAEELQNEGRNRERLLFTLCSEIRAALRGISL